MAEDFAMSGRQRPAPDRRRHRTESDERDLRPTRCTTWRTPVVAAASWRDGLACEVEANSPHLEVRHESTLSICRSSGKTFSLLCMALCPHTASTI